MKYGNVWTQGPEKTNMAVTKRQDFLNWIVKIRICKNEKEFIKSVIRLCEITTTLKDIDTKIMGTT